MAKEDGMSTPGFTAAFSLERTGGRYRSASAASSLRPAIEAAGGSSTPGDSLDPPAGHGCGGYGGDTKQGGAGAACGLNGAALQTDCSAADIVAKFARCRANGCLNSVYNAATCIVTCR
jgi:hypothetical protein